MMDEEAQTAGGIIPEDVRTQINRLHEAVDRERLPRGVRQEIIATLRHAMLPRRRRKTDPRIDAAYADYQSGMRGLEFYRKHIPNHGAKSHYRRRSDERRLMNSIHQRLSRERKAAQKTQPPAQPIEAQECQGKPA